MIYTRGRKAAFIITSTLAIAAAFATWAAPAAAQNASRPLRVYGNTKTIELAPAEEEMWVAKERNRTPRTRAELASLVDTSVLKEAIEQVSGREPPVFLK